MTAAVLPRHGHILLIGGQRCGTTWLQNLLAGHRDIRLPRVARPEPKFFLDDVDHGRYDELFPQVGGSWLLDKSTTYLERGDAAGRAAQCVPDAWVMVILRDPVARAYSNWSFSTANGLEDLSAEAALTEEAEQRRWTGLSTSPYHYLRRSRYAALLEPWHQAFGERLIVIQHERAIADSGPSYVEQQTRPDRPRAGCGLGDTPRTGECVHGASTDRSGAADPPRRLLSGRFEQAGPVRNRPNPLDVQRVATTTAWLYGTRRRSCRTVDSTVANPSGTSAR